MGRIALQSTRCAQGTEVCFFESETERLGEFTNHISGISAYTISIVTTAGFPNDLSCALIGLRNPTDYTHLATPVVLPEIFSRF